MLKDIFLCNNENVRPVCVCCVYFSSVSLLCHHLGPMQSERAYLLYRSSVLSLPISSEAVLYDESEIEKFST